MSSTVYLPPRNEKLTRQVAEPSDTTIGDVIYSLRRWLRQILLSRPPSSTFTPHHRPKLQAMEQPLLEEYSSL
jgi:hypothetical protein